ncbi:hypothetical protein E2562_026965 [Oryza meyeriana var. granulata]|uniref:Malvidin galactosylase UGT88C3 n=1 Tax=Oryza meyeriana var. granulata TaxID=110450 RepID=A0A6G1BNY2_9ORYZ|nr:hypothetical protein E2562_026965 [Oryza meyeriana var. granulata]
MARPTVVLLPVWGAGHFMPMIEAGMRLLRCSGGAFSVTVLLMPAPTSEAAVAIAAHVEREEASGLQDITFHRLPPVELPNDHTGVEEFISRIVRSHGANVKAAIAGLTPCPVAALVTDIFCTPALNVAAELGVPSYVYSTSGAVMLALLLHSPALDKEVPGEFGEMDGSLHIPGLPPVPTSALPATMLDKTKLTYRWFLDTGRGYMKATGFIVNTAAELEQSIIDAIADGRCTRGMTAPTVYPIGPVLALTPPPEQPHECTRWLDAQPRASVLFLCFGSKGLLSPPKVREIAAALERSEHRFLWVLRGPPKDSRPGQREPTDAMLDEMLPKGFLEKTKGRGLVWPTRAPQKDILAHAAVGGFVTHCGWNSILESLWFGVPMLPWPLDNEQHINAFFLVTVIGVAVPLKLDRKRNNFVEAAELERAVSSLLGGGEEGRKAREKALEMKAACRKAVEKGGSSDVAFQRLTEEVRRGAVVPKK